MSVSKKENKEDTVQLTQEDIQILSEYFWDMREYTSRFGFFYLGSDKENVKGLTKWQAEHIYQLIPIPPGMEDPLQNMEKNKRIDKEKQKEIQKQNEVIAEEYIVRAVQEKNLLYLSFFLHGYEHKLNGKVYSFLKRNGMDTYDSSRDAKFLTYLHHFIYDTFKFFRMQQECWTIDSLDTYKPTRRMAAIYNANCQDKKKSMKIFCQETGYTQKKAEEYLAEAIGIRARQTEVIIDRDEDDTAVIEEIVPDGVGNLCRVISNDRLIKAVRASFNKLPWQERQVLQARNAICNNCGGMQPMKEQFSFREIAVLTGCGTEKGGQLAYQAALDCLIRQLTEDEVFRIINLKQKAVTRRKKKIAAATYLYQADCDGEWGEIYIDFVNKKAKIIQLADWDLIRSRVYARTAIRYLISTGGRNLPKKRRVIFEPQRPLRRQHKRKFGGRIQT